MAKVIVQNHVEDYEKWKPVFDEHGGVRKGHGATGHTIHRGVEDPNTILIVNDFSSAEGAASFLADPSLKEAMAKAGVDGPPQIWVVEEVERTSYQQ